MGFGEWALYRNGSDELGDWIVPEWAANIAAHAGWSLMGQYVFRRAAPMMFWEIGIDDPVDTAVVEAHFHNDTNDPDFVQFCLEHPLVAGQTVTLGFYQEWYVSCGARVNMIVQADGPTFQFIRVGKWLPQPASLLILNYPGIGNIPMVPYSQSEYLCEYAVSNSLGFCLLRGNTITGKWTLQLPWPGGGWEGEKLYGLTPQGNFQRTSPAVAGSPDCLIVT
jgi:hypothetical protein